jgi:hypothetical protein
MVLIQGPGAGRLKYLHRQENSLPMQGIFYFAARRRFLQRQKEPVNPIFIVATKLILTAVPLPVATQPMEAASLVPSLCNV